MAQRAAFNFDDWIRKNEPLLKPPVSNRHLFDEDTDMIVMVVGGPNLRTDYHDDPAGEFFYQVRGNMTLKVVEGGEFYDVPISEGEVFYIPPHVRHSPQRPETGSIGLVVEGNRNSAERDAFEWFCLDCGDLIFRKELTLHDIVEELPVIFRSFYDDVAARTCAGCGALHPGEKPPVNWGLPPGQAQPLTAQ
jgi:3-hydroxyanthranilate 3,4-dioxygenase